MRDRAGPQSEGRAHVALRGGRQRGHRRGGPRRARPSRPRRWPSTSPSSCASARTPAAPRSPSRRASPSTSPRRSRSIQTQELYTLHGVGGGHRARHPPADRRHRPGHDRLPVRAGAGRRRRARAPRGRGLRRRRDRADPRGGPGRHPQPARPGHAATSAARSSARRRSTPPRCLQIVEQSMSSEIYELMKRSDEGHVVEKAHRRPRFVEDCVREMVARRHRPASRRSTTRAFVLGAPGQPRDDPPAQRRRRALRHDGRDPRRAARPASPPPIHTSLQAWLAAAP